MRFDQLLALIERLKDPSHPCHDMLDFYIERKKEYMKDLSKVMNKAIKG